MLWQILLNSLGGTLAAITLAVGGFWAFLKWGSQTMLGEWLKRDYKKWELEAENPYNENISRLEGMIDMLNARDDTRYKYYYTIMADDTRAIFKLATEAQAYDENRYKVMQVA